MRQPRFTSRRKKEADKMRNAALQLQTQARKDKAAALREAKLTAKTGLRIGSTPSVQTEAEEEAKMAHVVGANTISSSNEPSVRLSGAASTGAAISKAVPHKAYHHYAPWKKADREYKSMLKGALQSKLHLRHSAAASYGELTDSMGEEDAPKPTDIGAAIVARIFSGETN